MCGATWFSSRFLEIDAKKTLLTPQFASEYSGTVVVNSGSNMYTVIGRPDGHTPNLPHDQSVPAKQLYSGNQCLINDRYVQQ